MKKLVFSLIVACISILSYAQRINVGDVIPNLPLHYQNGKTINLYDSKKPYAIIYIWSFGCSSCIESFPKLKKFQEHYGKDMDLLIANIDTKKWLEIEKKRRPGVLEQVPNSFIYASEVRNSFPLESVSQQVWVDMKTHKVLAITGAGELTDDNILDMLAGKSLNLELKQDIMRDELMETNEDITNIEGYNKFKWDTIAGMGRQRGEKARKVYNNTKDPDDYSLNIRGGSYRNYVFSDLVIELLPWSTSQNFGDAKKRVYGFEFDVNHKCCFEWMIPAIEAERMPYREMRECGLKKLQEASGCVITLTKEVRPVWVVDYTDEAKLHKVEKYTDTLWVHVGKVRNASVTALVSILERSPLFKEPVIAGTASPDGIDMDNLPAIPVDQWLKYTPTTTVEQYQAALAKYGVKLYMANRVIDMIRVDRKY